MQRGWLPDKALRVRHVCIHSSYGCRGLVLGACSEGEQSPGCAVWQEVERALEGGMEPVLTGVQRCLAFYLGTGAITARTEASLRALLASLQAGGCDP